MSILDIIFLVPLLWFAYKGFSNGLAIEIASLMALILGIYLSLKFSIYVGKKIGLEGNLSSIFAFIITFLAVVILVNFIGKFVGKIFEWTSLGIINKIAGLVFGVIKISFILSVMIYIIEKIDNNKIILSKETKEKSIIFPYMHAVAPKIIKELKIEEINHIDDDY